jgi:LytS/YehU family sensor histidine kinase
MQTTKKIQTEKLVLLSLFTALVAILADFGGFIKIGGLASISLTLIPVVLGAAMCGPWAGAWLGGVSGVVFFMTADAAFWMGLSIPGTIITVMVKGIAAGLVAGLVYKLLEKKNRYVAVIAAAIVCPVVNTGIFPAEAGHTGFLQPLTQLHAVPGVHSTVPVAPPKECGRVVGSDLLFNAGKGDLLIRGLRA